MAKNPAKKSKRTDAHGIDPVCSFRAYAIPIGQCDICERPACIRVEYAVKDSTVCCDNCARHIFSMYVTVRSGAGK